VNFAFDEQQREIQAIAKELMNELGELDRVVEIAEGETGWREDDWAKLSELGWTGMHIPEEYGGVGLSQVELVVVLEQMGARLLPSPFFSTVCLAANALLEVGPDSQRELIASIAEGQTTATLALNEGGDWGAQDIHLEAAADGDGWKLSGTKRFVTDGATAQKILVAARTGGSGTAGVSLFVVDAGAAGLTRTPAHSVDDTRRIATLQFDGVSVGAEALVGETGKAWPGIESALQLASVALAAELLGAAQHCFDTALQYAKDRIQFGRPIASFQAVKHMLADLLMIVEQTRSAVYYAGWAASNNREELPVVGPLVKAQAADAFTRAARDNIQIHGGIGFTWEHEAHRYYRRAQASAVLLGDSDRHRELMLVGLGV
jgi:alkylation response protein AidB-like acyl-CoA dehydrogenase